MDQITIGQIAMAVTFLVGFIGGIGYLKTHLEDWFRKPLQQELKPIKDQVNEIEINSCKNFLVRSLQDVERGVLLSEVELERFWEQYDHYRDKGGNSYIKETVERLKLEGKLTGKRG